MTEFVPDVEWSRLWDLVSHMTPATSADRINFMLKRMATMHPFDRDRLMTLVAQKTKIPATTLS